VRFSIPKTDLICWRTSPQSNPPDSPVPPPIYLDGQVFPTLLFVKWCGYLLTPGLSLLAQFSNPVRQDQGGFTTFRRLLPHGTDLSPHLSYCQWLVILLLLPSSYMEGTSWSPPKEPISGWMSFGITSNARSLIASGLHLSLD